MIELKDWQYKLIQRLSNENNKRYEVLEIKGVYYINSDELFDILDDTQNNREYGEEKLVELADELDRLKDKQRDDIPGLEKAYQKALERQQEEIENLKEENEILKDKALRYCNEDDLDRLNFEGVRL